MEGRRHELEMLAVRREADDLFAENEEEKNRRKFNENKGFQESHLTQMVGVVIQSNYDLLIAIYDLIIAI